MKSMNVRWEHLIRESNGRRDVQRPVLGDQYCLTADESCAAVDDGHQTWRVGLITLEEGS